MKAIKEDLKTKVTNCYDGGCDIVMYCKGDLNEQLDTHGGRANQQR